MEKYKKIDGIYFHRMKAKMDGQIILRGWHVHHINGNTRDNSKLNLIPLPPTLHEFIHTFDELPSREVLQKMLLKNRQYITGRKKLKSTKWKPKKKPKQCGSVKYVCIVCKKNTFHKNSHAYRTKTCNECRGKNGK